MDNGFPTERTLAPAGEADASAPYLRVVRGDATPEEIAALVATLTALAAARADAPQPEKARRVSGWADRARLLRPAVHPAPGGWRRSALPR